MSENNLLIVSTNEDAVGWFKLCIPEMEEILGGLVPNPAIRLLTFLYCKLGGEVAFDDKLSVPFLTLEKVLFASQETKKGPSSAMVLLVPLKGISPEHEDRCYIPASFVSCIIPLNPKSSIINTLVNITNESHLVMPTADEMGKILHPSKVTKAEREE